MRIASGTYGGRTIRTCEGPGYRPATGKVRQAVFSMLEARGMAFPGARVIDVFAGSGSLGMEALSRGAELAWFLELAPRAARLIRDNLRELGVPAGQARVVQKDALATLKRPPLGLDPFDLAFVDPPYGKDLLLPAVRALVSGGWLAPGAFLLAEVEAGVNPGDAAAEETSGGSVLPPSLEQCTNRLYGQTRILLWQHAN